MPESEEHSRLVAILRCYIAETFCNGKAEHIYTDSTRSESLDLPPSIAGFIPDAYVSPNLQGGIVIGEAKSIRDLENSHTEGQVIAFLRRCRLVNGSVFILAVPWPIERLARTFLTNLQARAALPQVETIVISDANRTAIGSTLGRLTHCRS